MSEVATGELIVAAKLNAVELFTGPKGVESILTEIEAKVASFVPDTSTAKSRKEIASMAYKVSQSKVLLDGLGEKLTLDWKAQSKLVDLARKTARDRLDALRDKTRQPLTDWEEAEEARLAAEQLAMQINEAHTTALAEHDFWMRNNVLKAKEVELARIEAERVAKEEAELAERLAKEEAARFEADRVENEARIAREAAERATKDAEEAAKAEMQAAMLKASQELAAERAEREKSRLAILAAEEAAEKADRDRLAAIETAKREQAAAVAAAEEHARKQAERLEANRKEKERLDAEIARLAKVEAEKKAADVEHRRSINKEVVAGLVAAGLTDEMAKAIITAIVGGLVKNVAITY